MVNTVWVNADHGHDFHSFADHMTQLRISSRLKFKSYKNELVRLCTHMK